MERKELGNWGWMLVVVMLLVAAAGCSKGTLEEQSKQVIAGGGELPEIRVSAVAPTDATQLANLEVDVSAGEGGYDVMISTGDNALEATEIFLKVEYDSTLNHAYGLNVDAAADSESIIGLAVEPSAGAIDLGAVLVNNGTDEGLVPFTAGTPLLSFKLIKGAADRTVSATTGNMPRARNLEFRQDAEANWVLSWDYTNPGDNNQDGLVSASDLTPIGQNWLARVTNDWDDPLRNVDGNHDGEINVSDITAIGQNYEVDLHSYKIEMSEDGVGGFITVGELPLGDVDIQPGQAVRFEYTFGAQYVEGAWYRVKPMDKDLNIGPASEAISELGRRMDEIECTTGQTVTITVNVSDLPHAIAHLNSVRIIYPDTFHYVPESANAGKLGGSRSNPDGIWSTFVTGMIFPDEYFFVEEDMGNNKLGIAFNVTTLLRDSPGATVGYGDLVNFKLQADTAAPLTLEFQDVDSDGIKRTFYSVDDGAEYFFGNAIGFRVQ